MSSRWVTGMLLALGVSTSGTFLQLTAQAGVAWETTHRAAFLGLLGLVQATPLRGGPMGGVLAEQLRQA